MTRHEQREQTFRILFSIGFHKDEDLKDIINNYMEDTIDEEISEADRTEITVKVLKIAKAIPELDEKIDKVAEGWKTNRMGKAELNILRLALYEIDNDDTVPVKVAINEAVELAKEYCNSDTPSFVNGILAHFA